MMKDWHETPSLHLLVDYVSKDDAEQVEVEKRLREYREELEQGSEEGSKLWPYKFLINLDKLRRREINSYPVRKIAYVLRARQGKGKHSNGERVFLEDHLAHVEHAVVAMASGLDEDHHEALRQSARLHDYGKVDVRYQAWLRGGDRMAARFAPKPIAKSGNYPLQKQKSAGLPEGFRHELLSLMFAEKSPKTPKMQGPMRDLMLHLVAAHHGCCRPFAPVVLDEDPEDVSYGGLSICKQERMERAPHRLDSGIADRFWRLTAKYGWWGLAYLEALLRLADWQASMEEVAEVSN
jgi:CRISPR-associated endonuclease/helicase Cas3